MKLLRHMLETLAIALFSMCLRFLFVAAIVWGRDATGVDADGIWFIKAAGTFLMPFGMVLWSSLSPTSSSTGGRATSCSL